MDHEDPRRRHASNGSLHSAFSRASSRPGRSTFPRTPRRNRSGDADVEQRVTETPGFLRSPGPLESMLKTTTETGDIGLFSIRPNGLSAAQRVPGPPSTYHGPPRPRPSLPSMQHPRPARHTHYAEEYHDDRRRLPSTYRDTTSEILSLYGADTPRSNAQSLSPSVDDPRSYSITTTSSRQDPHRSTGTPQSYQGSGESQRSHSPFPYPTRLKRPGVRPSSPAVTEAGASDYGRMIRQDRTSHRTTHGAYGSPAYFRGPRYPTERPLWSDNNRSSSSLPARGSPRGMSRGYHQPRTPNSTWSYRQMYPPAGASRDQSSRSASLNSIVDMYNRPMGNSHSMPQRPTPGAMFYDYSEQFENETPPPQPSDFPLCPIPQRTGSNSRPMILREESLEQLDRHADAEAVAATDQADGHVETIIPLDMQNRGSFSDPATTSSDQFETPIEEYATENEFPPGKDARSTIRVVENGEAMLEDGHRQERPSRNSLVSNGNASRRLCSPVGRNTSASSNATAPTTATIDNRTSFGESAEDVRRSLSSSDTPKVYGPRPQSGHSTVPIVGRSHHRKYQRNLVATDFRESDLDRLKTLSRQGSASLRENAALSPEPLSPTRQLRVKNSTPRLMKALPPLPNPAVTVSDAPNFDYVDENRAPERLSLGRDEDLVLSQLADRLATAGDGKTRETREGITRERSDGKPKLRLRVSRSHRRSQMYGNGTAAGASQADGPATDRESEMGNGPLLARDSLSSTDDSSISVPAVGRRGLRQKISLIGLRLIGSRKAMPETAGRPRAMSDGAATTPATGSTGSESVDKAPESSESRHVRYETLERKGIVKRWALKTRKAVRSYVRKWDRNPREAA